MLVLGRRQTFPSDAVKAIILKRARVYPVVVAILFCGMGTMRAQQGTHLKLNQEALVFAVQLIKQGQYGHTGIKSAAAELLEMIVAKQR